MSLVTGYANYRLYRLYKTSISNASFVHNLQRQLSQCHVFILSLSIDREEDCSISAVARLEVFNKILSTNQIYQGFFYICSFLKNF